MKEAFKDITDVSKISLHSLRSGGAANAGIPDRLFMADGLARMQRTVMLTIWSPCCLFLVH